MEQAASFCSKYLLREARKEKLAQQEAQRLAKLAKEMAVKAAQVRSDKQSMERQIRTAILTLRR